MSPEYSFISIGCSCIVETQIGYRFNDRRGGIFDYMTTTPGALIDILKKYKDNGNFDFLINAENYENISIRDSDIPFHKEIDGMILNYGELNDPSAFESKNAHQINNILSATGKKYFVWSNLQSNLYQAGYEFGIDIDQFYLTSNKYILINNLIKDLFDGECIFIVREEYTDPDLLGMENVHPLILENYEYFTDHPNYLGPERFFDNILNMYVDKI
jgi:hypothetical protein